MKTLSSHKKVLLARFQDFFDSALSIDKLNQKMEIRIFGDTTTRPLLQKQYGGIYKAVLDMQVQALAIDEEKTVSFSKKRMRKMEKMVKNILEEMLCLQEKLALLKDPLFFTQKKEKICKIFHDAKKQQKLLYKHMKKYLQIIQ